MQFLNNVTALRAKLEHWITDTIKTQYSIQTLIKKRTLLYILGWSEQQIPCSTTWAKTSKDRPSKSCCVFIFPNIGKKYKKEDPAGTQQALGNIEKSVLKKSKNFIHKDWTNGFLKIVPMSSSRKYSLKEKYFSINQVRNHLYPQQEGPNLWDQR